MGFSSKGFLGPSGFKLRFASARGGVAAAAAAAAATAAAVVAAAAAAAVAAIAAAAIGKCAYHRLLQRLHQNVAPKLRLHAVPCAT